MQRKCSFALASLVLTAVLPFAGRAQATQTQSRETTQTSSTPITITVDATDAPRKMLHADLVIPVIPAI